MDRRSIMAVAAVALMAAVCLVPAMAEESDGANQTSRFSSVYIMHGTVTMSNGNVTYATDGSILYFIEGSENHMTMEAYLTDQSVDVTKDDSDSLRNLPSGTVVHIYLLRSYELISIYTLNTLVALTTVLDPYPLTFFVKAGDTFSITVDSCVDNKGQNVTPYIYADYMNNYLSNGYTREYTVSTEVEVSLSGYILYADISYDVSGASYPNGSAAAYVAVCAAITVIVLGLLVMASIKPKWSK